jgi:hypothetical protein
MRNELSGELFEESVAELEEDFQSLLGVQSKISANQKMMKMMAQLEKWPRCIRDERATNSHEERQTDGDRFVQRL